VWAPSETGGIKRRFLPKHFSGNTLSNRREEDAFKPKAGAKSNLLFRNDNGSALFTNGVAGRSKLRLGARAPSPAAASKRVKLFFNFQWLCHFDARQV